MVLAAPVQATTPRAAARRGRVPGPHPPALACEFGSGTLPPRPHPPGIRPGARHDRHHAPPGAAPTPAARWPRSRLPGQKIPATTHGFLDATTDEQHIIVGLHPRPRPEPRHRHRRPRPHVLDIDQHGPDGNGFPAYARLRRAGLLTGASAYVRTPSGDVSAYFTGTAQRDYTCPTITWTSGPPAARSPACPPTSAATPTSSSRPPPPTAPLPAGRHPPPATPSGSNNAPRSAGAPDQALDDLARWVGGPARR